MPMKIFALITLGLIQGAAAGHLVSSNWYKILLDIVLMVALTIVMKKEIQNV